MLARSLALAGALLVAPVAPPSSAHADDGTASLHLRGVRLHRPHHGPRHVRSHVPSHVHRHRHGHCRYVPARAEIRRHRVVVPGHHVERVVPARYSVRWDAHLCAYVSVEVRPRRIVRTWVPARVEIRRRRVRVPARWICR